MVFLFFHLISLARNASHTENLRKQPIHINLGRFAATTIYSFKLRKMDSQQIRESYLADSINSAH